MASGKVRLLESGRGTIRQLRLAARAIEEPPDFATIGAMEAALRTMYADTLVRTHVITGSLKATGRTVTDFDGNKWTGSIVYGGRVRRTPSPGPPNKRVDYAIYEMARGGTHDFFGGLPAYDLLFEKAFNSHFDRHAT